MGVARSRKTAGKYVTNGQKTPKAVASGDDAWLDAIMCSPRSENMSQILPRYDALRTFVFWIPRVYNGIPFQTHNILASTYLCLGHSC